MELPTDRRYSDKHFWAKLDSDKATFGLTEYNVTTLGQVSSVSNLSSVGANLSQGDTAGTINRSNSTDDFVAPLGGHVIERDDHFLDISVVNSQPYSDASSFITVDGAKQNEYDALMSAEQYDEYIKNL